MNDRSHDLFEHYSRHYESMTGGRERLPDDLERIQRDRLPRWIDQIPKDARILDAGCAQGHLLAALRRLDYRNLSGIDLSSTLLEQARNQLPPEVQLEKTSVQEFLRRVDEASFDLIFFHDVLEHLPREETIRVLKGFYRILAIGGLLSVRVPNMGALIGSFTSAIDFTHVTHFSEFSLLQVLEASGFDPKRIRFDCLAPRLFWSRSYPHRSVFRLLNRVRWHLNVILHKGMYLLTDMYPKPKVFDPNIIVVAEKYDSANEI